MVGAKLAFSVPSCHGASAEQVSVDTACIAWFPSYSVSFEMRSTERLKQELIFDVALQYR